MRIGPIEVGTPVVLAPMAGVTNRSFRRLCRHYGAGLYVAEMVTSRALVERTPESLRIITHDPGVYPRSVQIYGVDPATVQAAVRLVVDEDRADHIDLNFGCPVPKVTRKGGGAALPWKHELLAAIVERAVDAAGSVPVTVKMRMGIDDDHLTFLRSAEIARDAGVAAIALHARTAQQHYSGHARWEAISQLKEHIADVPILGNGDIWSAEDALEMVRATGCDGVVVGRGCQGRPWLFADLAAAFAGSNLRLRPTLGEVADVIMTHAMYQVEEFGSQDKALRDLRKHMSWYLKGFAVGSQARAALALVSTLSELRARLDELDLDQAWPGRAAEGPRGRAGSPKAPALPDGWLATAELEPGDRARLAEAELDISGG